MTQPLPDDQLPPMPLPTSDGSDLPPTPTIAVKAPTPPQTTSPASAQPTPSTETSQTDDPTPLPVPSLTLTPQTSTEPGEQPLPAPVLPASPLSPTNEPVIAPPQKDDMSPEEKFPGQPIPPEEQKKVEEQAETLIKQTGGTLSSRKPPSKMVQGLLGVLALVLVGSGVFYGNQLIGNSTENRSQASLDDIPATGCGANGSVIAGQVNCCKNPEFPYLDGDGFCHRIPPGNSESIPCPPSSGISGTCLQVTTSAGTVTCYPVAGGAMFCGNITDGTACAPVLGGGGDWCTIIGGGTAQNPVSCASIGMMRCHCSNGQWVIGAASGDNGGSITCDDLCGGTNNVCTSCNPPDDEPPPPATHLECVNNDRCAYVAGGGANQCATDNDCDQPPGETLACTALSANPAAPKLGDSPRFTCTGTSTPNPINHFVFQYKIGNGDFTALAETSAGSGQSQPLLISDPGTYTVRCRACSSADNTNCSAWQVL